MTRQGLPNRRQNESIAVEFERARYTITIGYRNDGTPAEVFCHGAKSGSAMGRLHGGAAAASVIGTMVDHLAAAPKAGAA